MALCSGAPDRADATRVCVPRFATCDADSADCDVEGSLGGTHLYRRTRRQRPRRREGRHVGRRVALPADKIEYARLLKAQGASLGVFATTTDIPKTSLYRYLVDTSATAQS